MPENLKAHAGLLAAKVSHAFSNRKNGKTWLADVLPEARLAKLRNLGVLPSGIDPAIRETMHRTHMGCDADPMNLLLGGIKCALADMTGLDVSSTLSDILLGTPQVRYSAANLGVLDPDAVNVAIHGHNPLVSESILEAAPAFEAQARAAGAKNGINLVGICCTGNESLMRHGVPMATNVASQELAILTGALEAVVVDVQVHHAVPRRDLSVLPHAAHHHALDRQDSGGDPHRLHSGHCR